MKTRKPFLKRLRRIRHVGVPREMAPEEAKYIRMTNLSALGVLCGILHFIVANLLYFDPGTALGGIAMFMLTLLVYLFNSKGWYAFARLYIVVLWNVSLLIICVIVGEALIIHYLFFISAGGAILIFPKKETWRMIAMIFLSMVFFHIAIVMYEFSDPFYEIDASQAYVMNVALTYAVYAGIIFIALIGRFVSINAEDRLRQEQDRSESLLLNILPKPIAERLKAEHGTIADGFPEATVIFADMVGFTEMAERLDPGRLVGILNDVYSGFDDLCEKHGLEKIKTMGDSYIAVGGVPVERLDHAEAAMEMAMEMYAHLERYNQGSEYPITMRIGINTGPVVAGVIGKTKFAYDVWGDAVNTASRMESHGDVGMIQVTRETYERLKDKYRFDKRGMVKVKGKGDMETYFLRGRIN